MILELQFCLKSSAGSRRLLVDREGPDGGRQFGTQPDAEAVTRWLSLPKAAAKACNVQQCYYLTSVQHSASVIVINKSCSQIQSCRCGIMRAQLLDQN